jgi:membrane protease YdiL (CAAX protease family)
MKERYTVIIGGVDFDLKLTLIIILGTVLPMIDYYNHRITGTKAYDRIVLYFIIPMAIILLIFRDNPAQYGFRIGNWRTGLLWTVVTCAGMVIVLWFVARTPGMQRFYAAKAPESTLYLLYITAVDLFGWEFIWRGFLLFGMVAVLGPGPAIWLQAVPFAFMHLGKPEVETISTIFGGAAFGFIAWQSGSFLYPWIIHWFIASFTMLLASGRIG